MKNFDAALTLDEKRLCKRLHIDGDSFSDKSARKLLPKLKKIAEDNMNMKICYLEGCRSFKTGLKEVDDCEEQIICLVYASESIIHIISNMSERGDYLEAYLLNELTNDMLFNASNQLNKYLTEIFQKKGMFLTRKFFPGEKGIPLEMQKVFLDLLKKEKELDVYLTKSYMLVPEKAMLYAFGADIGNEAAPWEHNCRECDKEDCYFREE